MCKKANVKITKNGFVVTPKGLVILRKDRSNVRGFRVVLTRWTNKSGAITHGVVMEDRRRRHTLVKSFHGISGAWELFKELSQHYPEGAHVAAQ